jgi:thiol:disulfide interchange protein DsbD
MNRLDGLARGREAGGVAGALLMGFTFTLTSFTCTAPFVGSLLVMTAQGNWRWPLTGMLAYSTVFAIPFFVLALAPQLISRLPRAGGWMNSVKVVMGFLEIAAAMKFLSNADLVWRWGIFTRQTVLAVWIAVGILAVFYVLGYFRLSHDSPVQSIGFVRLMAAAVFLTTTIALVPGLFGRPLGELDSFLPPTPAESTTQAAENEPRWILNDLEGARRQAIQEKRMVFVDFTGYTCTNCRWMEANMFPRPEIRDELKRMVTVRLYTDGSGSVCSMQQKMQQRQFRTVALPLYVILKPDGTPVATFPGLTRDAGAFLDFLRRARTAEIKG